LQISCSFFNGCSILGRHYYIFRDRLRRRWRTSHACRTLKATRMTSWRKGTGTNFAADSKTFRVSLPVAVAYANDDGAAVGC
jgi:hypothetical protein